jgi:hypothetical protein
MSTGCAFRAVDVASLAWRARVATGAAVDAPLVLHQPYLATSLKVVHAGVPRPEVRFTWLVLSLLCAFFLAERAH